MNATESTGHMPAPGSMAPGRLRRAIPLPMLMGGVVVFCMLVVAATLMWQGASAARFMLLSAASGDARDMAVIINEKAQRALGPAEATLRQLAFDPVGSAGTLDDRLERLTVLTQVLVHSELISAVYAGYANGDFLLVRPLDNPAFASQFKPPAGTRFLVQSVRRGLSREPRGEWLFFDGDLNLLETRALPDYRFDPRVRAWYNSASVPDLQSVSDPYVFFTSREIGLTVSQRSNVGDAVLGVDVALSDLGRQLSHLRRTPNSEIAVVDELGRVMAYTDFSRAVVRDGDTLHFQSVAGLGVPALLALSESGADMGTPVAFEVNGAEWIGVRMPLNALPGRDASIYLAVPDSDLLATLRDMLRDQALSTLALVALLLPLGWLAGRQLGLSLARIAQRAQQLTRFNFDDTSQGSSMVREVKELDAVFGTMCLTMQNFLRTTEVISSEPRLDAMLERVLRKLVQTTHCRVGVVYLLNEDNGLFSLAAVAHENESLSRPDDVGFARKLPADFLDAVPDEPGRLVLPLRGRQNQLLGVLLLDHEVDDEHQSENFRAFANKLSGALSVSLETRHLFAQQQRLLEAVIQLLADAIDAKSPYTGGHCERVPELAEMLIDALREQRDGPYAAFDMNESERYAFRLAAWLHDCGKITSPEHIIDKATKLETIYNRIHEIRMRFEVLWRDARIQALERLAAGDAPESVDAWLSGRQQQLQDDFAFVARCNVGGEQMAQEDIDRLHELGGQDWWRHFDDRLGLSREEAARLAAHPAAALPARETLLADKPEHMVPWGKRRPPVERSSPANRWGFDMVLPDWFQHLGELYNLSVRRGTLTAEDRFRINDHIVQTYIMLRGLPWPSHLSKVPEMAASHHERLDGHGYPRRLAASQLAVPDRVMALADVFEALTAGDRPYKSAKTLSESLRIMTDMATEGHLDPELMLFFIDSRLWYVFACKFLLPEQMDDVDVDVLRNRLQAIARHPGSASPGPIPGRGG